ncbi:glycosyltransferase family 2 protein [Sulfitobacter sp. LCG007]
MQEDQSAPIEPLVRSDYFEKPEIEIADGEILVFCCLRNEAVRLPFFLKYYRDMGVSRFFVIDNGSDDGSAELLKSQPDVEYFHTLASYTGSSAGRLWMQELCDRYGVGHWCLTVDVDELFTFPGAEAIKLGDLVTWLDFEGSEGVFCPFLDLYSDLPLSKTQYRAGQDFREICAFFETDTYDVGPSESPPFLRVRGGPRGTIFQRGGGDAARGGPMMRKVPLMKWREGFSYIFSTHSHRFSQLSGLSGALLHFKFFDLFEELARREAARGDRRQKQDYEAYSKAVTGDLCFYSEHSHRYTGPRDLVQLGVMCAPESWQEFALERHIGASRMTEENAAGASALLFPKSIAAEGRMTLRSISAIWPFISNPAIAQHFGLQRLKPYGDAEEFARRARKMVSVVEISAKAITLHMPETIQHSGVQSGLSIAVHADGRLVGVARVDGTDPALRVDTTSLAANMLKLSMDLSEAGGSDDAPRITIHLFAGAGDAEKPQLPDASKLGQPIFDGVWHRNRPVVSAGCGFDGVVDYFQNGMLGGWLLSEERDSFRVPVTIYINDRIVSYLVPSMKRPDLEKMMQNPLEQGVGFRQSIPLGYFNGIGGKSKTIDVVAAGHNIRLRRCPIKVTSEGSMWWNRNDSRWQSYPLEVSEQGPKAEIKTFARRAAKAIRRARGIT